MNKSDTFQQKIELLENEIREKQHQLEQLRKNAAVVLEREHYLLGPGQTHHKLSALFGEQDDLIVIHNMGKSCSYCTMWLDGLHGLLPYIERRTAFVVVSPDPPEVQHGFAQQRGWRMQFFSDPDLAFATEMGFTRTENGQRSPWPGFSTFWKDSSGRVHHIAKASFCPGDPYIGIWHIFALLKDGTNNLVSVT